ncbi:energy-coupling factor transporter transmembrane protein EcfT [Thermococcus sp.]|uniref:energy-coupling factor transporter transmembrane component T family protein n=1 Tax=Thermococcus sp. TaxID=35749 RepID=UPI00261833F9|nr:energy-coupling factor transporter transmembrane component T [Thermococcus sp.]
MREFYVRKSSFLHSLDPRVKIVGTLLGILTLMFFNDPRFLFPVFFLILIAGRILGGIEVRRQLSLLKPLLVIVAFTLFFWPLIYSPWYMGLIFGVSFSLRLLSFGLLTFLLLMTTRQRELILGFVRLGLPYELGLTLTIALRYIPTLYSLAQTIMDAQRSRGLELDRGKPLVRLKKMTAVLIPLIVASLKTAHELSIALESRAFGYGKRRTFLRDIEMSRKDYAALAVIVATFLIAVYLRYSLGLGHVAIYRASS